MNEKPTNGPQRPTNFRDLGATTLFRITNFELFVKPNKYVMSAGLVSISFCFGYLVYMNLNYDDQLHKQNTLINEELKSDRSKSRWD